MHRLSLDLSSLFLKTRQHFCRSMYLFNRDTLQCDAFSPICSKQSICRTIVIEPSLFLANSVFLYAQTRQKVEATTRRIYTGIYTDRPSQKCSPIFPVCISATDRHVTDRRSFFLSLSYFHSRAGIKARQSQNTINVGIE